MLRRLALWLAPLVLFSSCGETEQQPSQGDAAGESSGGTGDGGENHGGSSETPGGSGAQAEAGGEAGSSALAGAGGRGSDAGAGGVEAGGTTALGEAGHGGEAGSDPGLPPPPNYVFVTSQSYLPGELGGLAGADQHCADLADAAGLLGRFVAWLSTSTEDARERLGSASGWNNTQDSTFADQQADLFERGQVYFPIQLDELGQVVAGKVATGTLASGLASSNTCNDWKSSSAADSVVVGEPGATAGLWTEERSVAACDEAYHLYCFQVDHAALIYPTPSQGRTAFVSSQTFALVPAGRDAADALCAADAQAADLSGTYVALLGTSTEGPLARLTQPTRPWVRPDGMTLASGNAWVTLAPLLSGITEQADGHHVGGAVVFGTDDLTGPPQLHCDNWTNPNATVSAVTHGVTGYVDARWYTAETGSCTKPARLICIEK